jgi:hypothetical protein
MGQKSPQFEILENQTFQKLIFYLSRSFNRPRQAGVEQRYEMQEFLGFQNFNYFGPL